jgi:hypothetical protein
LSRAFLDIAFLLKKSHHKDTKATKITMKKKGKERKRKRVNPTNKTVSKTLKEAKGFLTRKMKLGLKEKKHAHPGFCGSLGHLAFLSFSELTRRGWPFPGRAVQLPSILKFGRG